MTLQAVSLFAGVEGIGLGFERQGIRIVAQVEWDRAASRVLAHHWPDIPRFTDVREVTPDDIRSVVPDGRVDVLTGGFPCTDVSVAGSRAGLAEGTRSGLYRELIRLAEGLTPDWLVLENVPGLLSADADPDANNGTGLGAGTAFQLVLGDLTGWEPIIPKNGWRNSGICIGPHRSAAWRVLDARYFGVPQRRRRVFIVCHSRDRAAPAAVLLECESLRRDPETRRPSWARAASSAAQTALRRRVPRTDRGGPRSFDARNGILSDDETGTLQRGPGSSYSLNAMLLVLDDEEPVHALTGGMTAGADDNQARGGWIVPAMTNTGQGYWKDTDEAGTLAARDYKDARTVVAVGGDVTHALTSEGADASEDGTGRGTPIIAATLTAGTSTDSAHPAGRRREDDENIVAFHMTQDPISSQDETPALTSGNGSGCPTLGVAFAKAHRASDPDDAENWQETDLAPTLDAGGQAARTATAVAWGISSDAVDRSGEGAAGTPAERAGLGVVEESSPTLRTRPQAVAFKTSSLDNPRDDDLSPPLTCNENGQRTGSGASVFAAASTAVRRLTPRECERLQGFPDDHTLVTGTSDSTRYKELGNAVCVNVSEWVGWRLDAYENGWRP